ncbi:MAG: chromate efflux transporter [Propionicimonas sp.]
MTGTVAPAADGRPGTVREVFAAFLALGVTSFGGPVAHLGYFREAFVVRRRWLDERAYAELVALCQFLPGPASSQVGMAIGLQRAGWLGMLAAWTAFTLPSAFLMVAFAFGMGTFGWAADAGWIAGLKAAAVAVVANAVVGMARTLTPDRERATIAVAAMIAVLAAPLGWTQLVVIAVAGLIGLVWLRPAASTEDHPVLATSVPRWVGATSLALFGTLLVALPIVAATMASPLLRLADGFYRSGALVFGGGHVVLPLLEAETVRTGLVSHDVFLAGYGAAQAVPGPLFTFAAFLGYAADTAANPALSAAVALIAIFLPAALLVVGALPFWERLRRAPGAQSALMGVNAAVVGLLAAALYSPIFLSDIPNVTALSIAAAAFVALTSWRTPAWAVVLAAGLAGALLL